jgi:hypothetical protein
MSRSHHITKAQAVKRFLRDGDNEAMLKGYEKQLVKQMVRKFRPIYGEIHPSAKPESKLTGRAAHRVARGYVKRFVRLKKEQPDA